MANTINDLYLKYVNRVGKTLESDRYFQYMFGMVRAGQNTLEQKNQILHKVVDERWLSTIEEAIDAINAIIEKPRRFVTTSEEVVPVSLAKKITADSVRHLSMNTQFIAGDAKGDIQPTRILNVTTEESYDLYENRFIYHLIQRLVTFIDKRTDVIFWSTGDERQQVLKMESKVDDAYEEIQYKVEMCIKNKQSFAENDSENMQVFMRIDRVRRLVMALRNSSFCEIMAGCSAVKSPIQRTNLMMKDPDYRTCYKLWSFLESYEEVGYTIDVKDSALEFDEEYLFQMYTNMIANYTVFKSLLENDPRRIEEAPAKRHKVVKPKFVKVVKEQIVEDYDIPEVEIKNVIVKEATQTQLELEEKLQEALEVQASLLAEAEEREQRIEILNMDLEQATEAKVEAERLYNEEVEYRIDAEDRLESEVALRENIEKQLEAAQQRIAEEIERCKAAEALAERLRTEKEQALEEAENQSALRLAAEERIAQEAQARAAVEEEGRRILAEKDQLQEALAREKADHMDTMQAFEQESAARLQAEALTNQVRQEAAQAEAALRLQAEEALENQRKKTAEAEQETERVLQEKADVEEKREAERQLRMEAEAKAAVEKEARQRAEITAKVASNARAKAEKRADNEKYLRELIEARGAAETIPQFIRASRLEKRERARQRKDS